MLTTDEQNLNLVADRLMSRFCEINFVSSSKFDVVWLQMKQVSLELKYEHDRLNTPQFIGTHSIG